MVRSCTFFFFIVNCSRMAVSHTQPIYIDRLRQEYKNIDEEIRIGRTKEHFITENIKHRMHVPNEIHIYLNFLLNHYSQ